jgi:hypothetical protein
VEKESAKKVNQSKQGRGEALVDTNKPAKQAIDPSNLHHVSGKRHDARLPQVYSACPKRPQ